MLELQPMAQKPQLKQQIVEIILDSGSIVTEPTIDKSGFIIPTRPKSKTLMNDQRFIQLFPAALLAVLGDLKDIDMVKGDVVIAGKVLSAGDIETAKKIVAWSASVKAIEKIKEAKGTFMTIMDEMKKNPELKGLDILR